MRFGSKHGGYVAGVLFVKKDLSVHGCGGTRRIGYTAVNTAKFAMECGSMHERIVTVMGPTASGKSALGVELARALDGEIISADAFQVYRGLDIGTAKITPAEADGIPHHLIDIKEVTDSYTAAEFCRYARQLIAEITARGRVPLIVGGTGLYVQALLEGYVFPECGASQDAYVRWEELYAREGLDGLVRAMRERSPEYFETHPVPDKQRLIRALTVLTAGGDYRAGKASERPIYPGPVYALWPERERMYARIDARVGQMIEDGLEAEARRLYDRCNGRQPQAAKGIGYKEWWLYFKGEQTLARTVELIRRNTRRFAKRQQTWLRRMRYIERIPMTEDMRPVWSVEELANEIRQKWSERYDGYED